MNMVCIVDRPTEAQPTQVVRVHTEHVKPVAANRQVERDPNGVVSSFSDMSAEKAKLVMDLLQDEIAKL